VPFVVKFLPPAARFYEARTIKDKFILISHFFFFFFSLAQSEAGKCGVWGSAPRSFTRGHPERSISGLGYRGLT